MSGSTQAAPDLVTRQEADIGQALLAILKHLAEELHPGAQPLPQATLDGSLERDLGLDSLARVELLLRIERKFKVKLSEQVLGSAQTSRDLLAAVLAAHHLPRNAISAECLPDFATPAHALPKRAATLAEALQWHVDTHPDRLHILLEGGDDAQEGGRQISYSILWEKARKVAAALRDLGLDPGQTAGLMLPTTADYFYCFFGILFAGGIPVPIYPPARLSQIEDHFRRHAGILSNAQVAGGTFCAGADLTALNDDEHRNEIRPDGAGPGPMGPTRLMLGKPVIAAIAGHAVAGGLELAAWCDLRVVEEDAVLGVFCRRFGVPLIDGGTLRLPRLIGLSRALDLILTGRPVDASEALAIGLANRVVARGRAWSRVAGRVRQRRRLRVSWPPCRRRRCAPTGVRSTTTHSPTIRPARRGPN
jgi:enoyl-CoA hydratase/carnithine racemase/acyl carrier protein